MSDKNFQFVVRKGPKPGQIFPLLSNNISVGRDPMSDITLSDPEVSRYHARLTQTETGYQIQDMGSTNGTFIDSERLGSDPVTLVPGQAILFGSSVVVDYQVSGEDEAAMATVIDTSSDREDVSEEPAPSISTGELPPLPELDQQPVAAASVSPPAYMPESWPPIASPPPPPPPLVPTSDNDGDKKRRRNITIAGVSVLLLICCVCAILLSGYYYWGDPLMEWLGFY